MPSRGEGATSGFVDMFGSRLGGFTEPRESPRLSGVCWIPGSIWDGGIAGTPDSDGLSRVIPGAGPPPLSGNWADGSISAATANAGRRVRIATATSRGAFPDHLLVESEWGTLPHRCFDHDILTSSPVVTLCTLRGLDLLTLTSAPLMGTGTGSACFCLSAIRRTKFLPRFCRTRTARVRAWFFRHGVPPPSVHGHYK